MSDYKIENKRNQKLSYMSKTELTTIIKMLDGRAPKFQKKIIQKWEELEGRKFYKKDEYKFL